MGKLTISIAMFHSYVNLSENIKQDAEKQTVIQCHTVQKYHPNRPKNRPAGFPVQICFLSWDQMIFHATVQPGASTCVLSMKARGLEVYSEVTISTITFYGLNLGERISNNPLSIPSAKNKETSFKTTSAG